MKNPLKRKRYPVARELDLAMEVIRGEAWKLAEEGTDPGTIYQRLQMVREIYTSSMIYAMVGKDRKKLGREYVERFEEKARTFIEGRDPVSALLGGLQRRPNATTMRPRTPDNKGQEGSRKVEGNPQVSGDPALQRATKVREGH
ncbi:MAG TPA: hypothetical protein VFJ76_07980 [Solirubrobacterales bacterium]|nr:hypothetical protein [Solirubrobacterales bacterium]